jgi:glycosyltransferase involved in cell wall biosynthesis
MKVLFIFPYSIENIAENFPQLKVPELFTKWMPFFYQYCKAINDLGHESAIMLLSRKEKRLTVEKHNDGFLVFKAPTNIVLPISREYSFAVLRLLTHLTRNVDADVIHIHSYYSSMYEPIALTCKLLTIPFVAQYHGGSLRGFPLSKMYKRISLSISLRFAQKILVPSLEEQEILLNVVGLESKKIFRVNNGINTQHFCQLNKTSCRKELNLEDPFHYILFAGRLDPVKSIDSLIHAFATLSDRLDDAQLLIAGVGPQEIELKKLVDDLKLKKKVRFLGFVPYEKMPVLYNASDVFVLPSVSEAQGLVVEEAMACGTPVIASNVGWIRDTIHHMHNGLLVQPRNPIELYNAMNLLLSNDELARIISANCRISAQEFSWKVVAEKLIEIYEEALDQAGRQHAVPFRN